MNTDFLENESAKPLHITNETIKEADHAAQSQSPPIATPPVSTGKSQPESQSQNKNQDTSTPFVVTKAPGKRAAITYDPRQATLEGYFAVPEEKPYVVRAAKFIEEAGWKLTKTLRTALEWRQGLAFDSYPLPEFKMAVSRHEADILYRKNINLSNPMLAKSLQEYACFVTEEGDRLEQVFALRARYNKGLEWQRTKREACDETNRIKGDQLLQDIAAMLDIMEYPLHPEEREEGIHEEFLKPEWLTFEQFRVKIQQCQRSRTVAERKEAEVILDLIKARKK